MRLQTFSNNYDLWKTAYNPAWDSKPGEFVCDNCYRYGAADEFDTIEDSDGDAYMVCLKCGSMEISENED